MRRSRSKKGTSHDSIPLVTRSSFSVEDDDNHDDVAVKPRGLRRIFGGPKTRQFQEPAILNVETRKTVTPAILATKITITTTAPQEILKQEPAANSDPDENDTDAGTEEHGISPFSEALHVESGPIDTDAGLHPISNTYSEHRQSKTRMILSRPFGRSGLPHKLARNWVVEVSTAEWDADEYEWKYRILVQKRMLQQIEACSSFTSAFTWRSLRDFIWLEDALRAEFHGCLLLPLLSIAIGTADVANTQFEVDASLLRDWLGDILNGIRGHGEILLKQQAPDLMSSEAMEAFLYRHTDPLPYTKKQDANKSILPITSILDFPWKDSPIKEVKDESFVTSLWTKPFACMSLDNMCPGPEQNHSPITPRLPLDMMNCSSRALGDAATLDIQDSFVQYEPHDSSALATHSDLLEAERSLVASYRKNTMLAMDKVRLLTEEEGKIGAAWKRFAISLSNLFAYEKEVENSKVGELNKENGGLPYRKLNKQSVDELLRVMAKQKMERSTPGLKVLDAMLSAYMADLSAVAPAVNAYSEAVSHLAHLEDVPEPTISKQQVTQESNWSESFWAMTSLKFVEMKKTVSSFSNTASTAPSSTLDIENVQSQRKAFETRVFMNERLLRGSLTTLCRATPVRSARIAFQYFNIEAGQAALLNASALSLRAKISVVDPKSIAKLRQRHVLENKEDDKTELKLVQSIVSIGSKSKSRSSGESSTGPEDDDTFGDEMLQDSLRKQVIQLASEKPGKWGSTLALAIMEAVGIDDAEVQVEETTRDLRSVRRHAIGLRENLCRCVEAVDMLSNLILHGDSDGGSGITQSIMTTRHEFVEDIGMVFSGSVTQSEKTSKAASPSMSILSGARIVTDDPTGWVTSKSKDQGGKCRELTMTYIESRDAEIDNLLVELSGLLNAYQERLESVESFVYMQCVGIQLEKHFSKVRADSLAAFEKKTDITTAINIANRKRLPLLVTELEAKLEAVEPKVTHTTVKETKETHLVSKNLKTEIVDLATRRYLRVRETAIERVVQLMITWAKYEEKSTSLEIKAVGNAIEEVERTLKLIDVRADGISQVFTKTKTK